MAIKKCTKGYACGDACIERADACDSKATDAGLSYLNMLSKLIQSEAPDVTELRADIAKRMGGKHVPTKPTILKWRDMARDDKHFSNIVDGHIDYWDKHEATKTKAKDSIKAATKLEEAIKNELPSIVEPISLKALDGGSLPIEPVHTMPDKIAEQEAMMLYALQNEGIDEPEKLIAKANESLRNALRNAKLYSRIPSSKIAELIASDRWKSQYEIGKSRGTYNPELRQNKEQRYIFGEAYGETIGRDMSKAVIYCYAAGELEHASGVAKMYGDIICELKESVKAKASITMDDSLAGLPASPLEKASICSQASDFFQDGEAIEQYVREISEASDIEAIYKANDMSSYIEAQIHGQLTGDDIAALHFTEGKKPSKALLKLAEKKGIKIILQKEADII